MKTRRARRWLLVQLVSVPVSQEQENGEPQVGQTARERDEIRNGRDNMVANYHMAQPTRTWI
jgi:hypothetical protein